MRTYLLSCLPLIVLCLAITGCGGSDSAPGTGGTVNNGGETTDGDQGGDQGQTPTGALVLSGRLMPGQAAKVRPRAQESEPVYPYTVVAQSDQTGVIYRGETTAEGDFEISLPDDEVGNSFMVTVLGPDGRAVGPVVFETSDNEGTTGLAMVRSADLGTIQLPDDPTTEPIQPGADGHVAELTDPTLTTRLNEDGAPIGLASHGKGAEATAEQTRAEGMADADQDGLIDIFDADNDGNGIVDDFEAAADAGAAPTDTRANFFMNLKVDAERAPAYYSGSEEEIAARLAQDTVITFEVMTEAGAERSIVGAHLLETPGPAYLTVATVQGEGGPTLWSELGYAFNEETDRFDVFVCPNAVMDAGDTFTVEITYDDGSVSQYSRMINYVFKNIPKLVQYGTPEALTDFDVTSPTVNGTSQQPIPLDDTEDLVLVFQPPPDETGAPITGMNYTFQIFYNDATQGRQLNSIDSEATWPTPVPGQQGTTYYVDAESLGPLSEENTYTVTLPSELFPDVVVLQGGEEAAVGSYKIDITAEAPTGNAAIMLTFRKL